MVEESSTPNIFLDALHKIPLRDYVGIIDFLCILEQKYDIAGLPEQRRIIGETRHEFKHAVCLHSKIVAYRNPVQPQAQYDYFKKQIPQLESRRDQHLLRGLELLVSIGTL